MNHDPGQYHGGNRPTESLQANARPSSSCNRPLPQTTQRTVKNSSNLEADRLYYARNSNRTRKQTHQEHQVDQGNRKAREEEVEPEDFTNKEVIPKEELHILKTLADNSIDWPQHHSRTLKYTLTSIASYTTQLTKKVMVCYFTDHPPFLQDFSDWVETEMHAKNSWRMTHTIHREEFLFDRV